MRLDGVESALTQQPVPAADTPPSPDPAPQIRQPFPAATGVLLLSESEPLCPAELSRALRESGFVLHKSDEASSTPAQGASTAAAVRPDIVVSFSMRDERRSEHHCDAGSIAARFGSTWIAASFLRSRFLLIRSVGSAGAKPCQECVFYYADRWLQDQSAAIGSVTIPLSVQSAFAAALIAEAATRAADASPPVPAAEQAEVMLYDFKDLSSANLLLGRVPGCHACWPAQTATQYGKSEPAFVPLFEECSRTKITATSPLAHGLPNHVTQDPQSSLSRVYSHSRKLQLPAYSPPRLPQAAEHLEANLGIAEISKLLFLTFGRWNGPDARRPDRVLPTAGNLGSPSAFLIARNVQGLEPGAYFYLEDHHALARLDSVATGSNDQMFAGFGDHPSAPVPSALLIMIGNYKRISVKYGAFAYRLIHFDAGLFAAHFQALAHSLSLVVYRMNAWPEDLLTRHLALNTQQTPITAAIGLGPARPSSRYSDPHEEFVPAAVASPFPFYEGCDAKRLAGLIQDLSTRGLPPDWASTSSQTSLRPDPALHSGEQGFSTEADIWGRLVTRQSVRTFADVCIPTAVVAKVMTAVQRSARHRAIVPLVRLFVTLRDDSLQHRQWQTYGLGEHGCLVPQGECTRRPLETLFVDPAYAKVPVLFWLCGDVRLSPWRYRQTLTEIGQQAYSLMQQVADFNLEGVFIGGLWPNRVGSRLGLYFCDDSPMLAFACGLQECAASRRMTWPHS